MPTLPRIIVLALICLSSAGCSMHSELFDGKLSSFKSDSVVTSNLKGDPKLNEWWLDLHNENINKLQDKALNENFSLKAALVRLAKARGVSESSLFEIMPKGGINASSSVSKIEGTNQSAFFSNSRNINTLNKTTQAGVSLSWELPLFGQIPAILAQSQASEDQAYWTVVASKLSISSEIVNSYFEAIYAKQSISILESTLKEFKDILEFKKLMVAKGVLHSNSLRETESDVIDISNQISSFQFELNNAKTKLSIMISDVSDEYVSNLLQDSAADILIDPSSSFSKGLDASVIRTRPDVAIAESKVLAAMASAGFAKANLFPQFTLQGSFTAVNGNLDSNGLNNGNSKSSVAGIGIHIPLLDWFALKAKADAAVLEHQAVIFEYKSTITTAWMEATSANTEMRIKQDTALAMVPKIENLQNEVNTQETLLNKRLVSKIEVANSKIALNKANLEYLSAKLAAGRALVTFHKATGV